MGWDPLRIRGGSENGGIRPQALQPQPPFPQEAPSPGTSGHLRGQPSPGRRNTWAPRAPPRLVSKEVGSQSLSRNLQCSWTPGPSTVRVITLQRAVLQRPCGGMWSCRLALAQNCALEGLPEAKTGQWTAHARPQNCCTLRPSGSPQAVQTDLFVRVSGEVDFIPPHRLTPLWLWESVLGEHLEALTCFVW